MNAPESDCDTRRQTDAEFSYNTRLWTEFSDGYGAILVVGHGTRNPSGASQLLDLVGQMQVKMPAAKVFGCFLELAEPTIDQAMERLHSQGIKKTLVVPVLLFTAAHALQDIPDAVSAAAGRFGIEVIGQSGSLGTHDSVVALSQVRSAEVIALETGQPCPESACARVRCESGQCEGRFAEMGRIGLAMVGRGTSDLQAIAHMRRLTELKVPQLSVVCFQTGFFAGGKPDVDGLLAEAATWQCDTVLVQPHLLFEGELIETLRRKVLACRSRFPSKQWYVSRTLGADPKLADIFLELAQEQLLAHADR